MIRPHETEKSYAKENRRLWRCRVGAYPKLASSSGPRTSSWPAPTSSKTEPPTPTSCGRGLLAGLQEAYFLIK